MDFHPILPWSFGLLVLIIAGLWKPMRQRRREMQLTQACRFFHQQREHLEAKFFQLAAKSGKPRGLRWTNCDFENDVVYARDLETGDLTAFVAVEISFAAIEGGDMEGVEAVGNIRSATAVFRHREGLWTTEGRTVFNLNPAEAVRHFQQQLELVEHVGS